MPYSRVGEYGQIIDLHSNKIASGNPESFGILEQRIFHLNYLVNKWMLHSSFGASFPANALFLSTSMSNWVNTMNQMSPSTSTNHDFQYTENILFLYIYILDQLIFYGTKEHVGDMFFQLAALLFETVFNDRTRTAMLESNMMNSAMIRSLEYYLNFFPLKNFWLDQFRNLLKQLN